jgi:hypothetical protein
MARRPPRVLVADFRVSERVEEKIAQHGVTLRQLFQTLSNPYAIVRNRARGAAQYLFIGQDHGGACIAVPIDPTDEPTVWAPRTAWYCKASEWALPPPLD